MIHKTLVTITVLIMMNTIISAQEIQFPGKTLGIWFVHEDARKSDERDALENLLRSCGFSDVITFNTTDLIKAPYPFKPVSILWVCENDTFPADLPSSRKIYSRITRFLEDGGKVVLANQAVMMLSHLGIEKMNPETRLKQCTDNGYGRQLGYHAFREHPLFEGMNGGAYVLKPVMDTSVWQTGFFGDVRPSGKVIAMDWDYIFLREESRMILEYNVGKGKVLAIGGYLLYSLPNQNQVHLEKFTRNIFRYLLDEESQGKGNYWFDSEFKKDDLGMFEGSWAMGDGRRAMGDLGVDNPEPKLKISPGKSTGNYWDLAGERMLLMGTDHGGITEIWAHPSLVLKDYKVRYNDKSTEGRKEDLDDLLPEIEIHPSFYKRNYGLASGTLAETIVCSAKDPVAVVNYTYSGETPLELEISFRMIFRLMWPYSEKVLGDLQYSWNEDLQAFIASDPSGEFVTVIGLSGARDVIQSARREMMKGTPSLDAFITIPIHETSAFQMIIASSSEGFDKTLGYYLKTLADPNTLFKESIKYSQSLLDNSLVIETPDQDFSQSYQWALLATDRFHVTTPGMGSSLVAGYATSDKGWDGGHAVSGRPGYGWYFGRDGVWSGLALLYYGDFDKVRLMLEMFGKYQDLNGKIFHELSTSGIVHYDASDATPLYIILAGRYLRHSGDTAFIKHNWENIKKAIDFCYSTDTDGDLLIENTNVGHGWVEGGHLFGSHTSLYLASCWAAALEEAAYLAESLDIEADQERYAKDAVAVKKIINSDFWFETNDYYYHGLMPDGTYMEETSIMPAIPMLFGQADPDKVKKVLPVIAANAFTSDWGCRIVPEYDPRFNPRGYHTGSVWPLFTGWAALAEFRNSNYLQGFSHLASNMMISKFWGLGFTEEVLNGEIFQPAGVCHHQCWSETMTLQPAIEGMLGYRPDALKNRINLSPWFPADWDTVRVMNIRMGEERIGMEAWGHGGMGVGFVSTFNFTKSSDRRVEVHFQPVLPAGCKISKITMNGQPIRDWDVRQTDQGWVVPEFGFWLDSAAVVEIYWHGGVTALPLLSHPQPGERSQGFRILETGYDEDSYSILLQAPRASRQEFKVWAAEPGKYKVEGAEIVNVSGNVITLTTEFPDLETDYAVKLVVILRK